MTEEGFKPRTIFDFKMLRMYGIKKNKTNIIPMNHFLLIVTKVAQLSKTTHTFLSFSTLAPNLEKSIKRIKLNMCRPLLHRYLPPTRNIYHSDK